MHRTDIESNLSPHFWLGSLSATVALAIIDLEKGVPTKDIVATLRRSLAEYEASPVHRPREIVAVAVVAANGECYALRDNELHALVAKGHAEDYLFGAQSSGHPASTGWVRERLPFRVIAVDAEERDALLEDGTPILDQEP